MLNILITIIAFLVVFLLGEVLVRKFKVHADMTRKFSHVLSGVVVFFFPYYLTRPEIISLCILFTVLLLISKSRNIISSIHSVDRKTLGEVYFPVGIIVSAALFLPQDPLAFQFGILVMTISDAAAALIGIRWGKHSVSVLGGKKSVEGSIAFFLTSLIIYFFFRNSSGYTFILIPLLLTCIEFLLSRGFDNLVLPAAAAYLLIIFK